MIDCKRQRQSELGGRHTEVIEELLERGAAYRCVCTREELETRKLVERAKGLLMKSSGLSEDEAFRRMQKKSMNSRKSLREVAEAMILSSEI